jgi:hypothetical protein
MSVSRAIATAINKCKQWCRGGGGVTAATKAKACRALAQWEKMKARNMSELELAEGDDADEVARKIVEDWNISRKSLQKLLDDSETNVQGIINRAGSIELKKAGFSPEWKSDTELIASYLEDRGAEFIRAIDETVKEELKVFLANAIREEVPQDEIANRVREHFDEFPDWKANRVVRSEVRNAYNFGTLAAGEQAGIKKVQAKDAQLGDTDQTCVERNGKIFDIAEALSETLDEHPNGTLEWILLKQQNLSIKYIEEMPEGIDSLAYFDDENDIIYIREDIPVEVEKQYLLQLGDILANE